MVTNIRVKSKTVVNTHTIIAGSIPPCAVMKKAPTGRVEGHFSRSIIGGLLQLR